MGDLKEILKDITDFEKEKFSIVNLPNKYENYIYINLAILYKLVYDDDDKIVFDNNIIDKIKNYMFKSICNYLSSYTKLNDDYSTTIEYIKQKYKDIECETSPPIAEKEVDVVEDVNVVKEVDEEVKEEVIFSVNKNTPFTITAIGDNEYKIKLIKDSAIDITGFEENVRVTKDTNGYYLILKHNDNTELYIYQYQQQDNKLKFKIVHPSNSIMYEVSINTDDEHTIEFTSGNKSDKNDENVLFLILLYFCQFNFDFNIHHKNYFKKILDLNQKTPIFNYWNKIFGYFGYHPLVNKIQQLKDIQDPDKAVPTTMKFIGRDKEFTISSIADKSDEFNANFDSSFKKDNVDDSCEKLSTFKVKKEGNKYFLQLKENIQVENFNNDKNNSMKYINEHNSEKIITINDGNINIDRHPTNLRNYTSDINELLLILLYAVLNNYDTNDDKISSNFKNLNSLKTTYKKIYCYWKIIFKYFGKDLDDFLNKIDNYYARYNFAIAKNLKFKLETGNKLILENSGCNNGIISDIQEGNSGILNLEGDNLRINVNHDIYFIIGKEGFNYFLLKFKLNNEDDINFNHDNTNLTIDSKSINNFDHQHKNDILFLILLFLYLKEENKDNLKHYYSKFYDLIVYNDHNWKDIFCSFGISNDDYNDLMKRINDSKEENDRLLTEQNDDKEKISKGIVKLSNSIYTQNIHQRCSNNINTNVWNVDSFKDTNTDNVYITLNSKIKIYIDTNLNNISVKIDSLTSINYILQQPINIEYTYKKCHSTDDKLYTLYTIVFNAHHYLLEEGKYLKFPTINSIFHLNLNDDIKTKLIKSLYFSNVDDYGFYVAKDKIKDDKNIDEYAVYYLQDDEKYFPNINTKTYKIVYDNLFQDITNPNKYLLSDSKNELIGNDINRRKFNLSIKNFLYYYDKNNNIKFVFNDDEPLKLDINDELQQIDKANPLLTSHINSDGFYTNESLELFGFSNELNKIFYFNKNTGFFYTVYKEFPNIKIYVNIHDSNDLIPPIYNSKEIFLQKYSGDKPNNIIFKLVNIYHTFINNIEYYYDENTSSWIKYETPTQQQTLLTHNTSVQQPTLIYYPSVKPQIFVNSYGQKYYYDANSIVKWLGGRGGADDDDNGEKIFNAILVYIFNKLIMLDKESLKNFFNNLKTS